MESRFYKLSQYFKNSEVDEITLSYSQIENIIGEELSKSAYKHNAYLSNDIKHSIARCWLNNGYKSLNNKPEKQLISFIRESKIEDSIKEDNMYDINNESKQNIISIMKSIKDDIQKTKGDGTYNNQRQSIINVFKQTSGENYNRQGIELRLIVIDSLYSTNMSKRYFAFDELSISIANLGHTEEEVIKKVSDFRNIPTKNSEIYKVFEEKKYGIHKNGDTAGEAKSLLSKYFYFQMMFEKSDRLGFPIYDSLAKNMYKP